MPEGDPLGYILLLAVLIALNALFAMSEIAVISFNDSKLRHLAEDGNKRAMILYKLTREPSKFLATIQVGVTLSGLLASAVAADTFAEYIVYWLRNSGIPTSVVKMVSIVIITLILSFMTLVFGELVPKRIGMSNPEKISFAVAGILRVVYIVTKPFVALLSGTTNLILRLIGVDPDQNDHEVTEEEIRMMIDVGEEDGTIEQSEKEMLHNIFEFDDRTADDVMTHRTEISALDIKSPLTAVISAAMENGHSRLPVCDGGVDNIIGILNIKDLLNLIVSSPSPDDFDLSKYMREVMYVPESSRCKDIFEEFRRRKIQLAVVVDEYGGTSGIITMEDILESIVGNIQDEYDHEIEEIRKLNDCDYQLAGSALLEDIEDELGIKFSDTGDYDTIAGYIIDKLGHLPSEDERAIVNVDSYSFEVAKISEHRISEVKAEKINLNSNTGVEE
ncbi:MAG: hemolysin family protein [Oscillospiraceae bacterium]